MNPQEKATAGPPTITVTVNAAITTESKEFTWPKTKKVGDAANEAALAFGYDVGGAPFTFQDAHGRVLDPQKPLVAENVEDGAVLELVGSGGGV